MRSKWYDNKDLKILMGRDYGDWLEFNRLVDFDTTNKFNKKQRVMLYFRYRNLGINKLMSMENISRKTGIGLADVKSFFKFLRTPDIRICPITKHECDCNDKGEIDEPELH